MSGVWSFFKAASAAGLGSRPRSSARSIAVAKSFYTRSGGVTGSSSDLKWRHVVHAVRRHAVAERQVHDPLHAVVDPLVPLRHGPRVVHVVRVVLVPRVPRAEPSPPNVARRRRARRAAESPPPRAARRPRRERRGSASARGRATGAGRAARPPPRPSCFRCLWNFDGFADMVRFSTFDPAARHCARGGGLSRGGYPIPGIFAMTTEWSVEYAPTGRAKCKKSKELIAKGEIRFGKTTRCPRIRRKR